MTPTRTGVELQELGGQLAVLRTSLVRAARTFVLNQTEAEDLVHAAFVKALTRPHMFRPETNLDAWMRKVMRNLAIDRARKPPVGVSFHLDDFVPAAEMAIRPESWERFSIAHVKEALGGLSPVLRQPFELHYFVGLSYQSIAIELRIRVPTVGTRLSRARQRLRRFLEDAAETMLLPDLVLASAEVGLKPFEGSRSVA